MAYHPGMAHCSLRSSQYSRCNGKYLCSWREVLASPKAHIWTEGPSSRSASDTAMSCSSSCLTKCLLCKLSIPCQLLVLAYSQNLGCVMPIHIQYWWVSISHTQEEWVLLGQTMLNDVTLRMRWGPIDHCPVHSVCCKVWCEIHPGHTGLKGPQNRVIFLWWWESSLLLFYHTHLSISAEKKMEVQGSWVNNLKHWQQQNQTAQSFTPGWNLGCLGAALPGLYQSNQGTFSFQRTLEIFSLFYNGVQLPVATPGKRKPKWFSSATFFSRQSILIKPTCIWPHNLKRYFKSCGVKETSCDT